MLEALRQGEATVSELAALLPIARQLEVIDRLDEIPGVGSRSAEELIAEIGLDMTAPEPQRQ